MPALRDGDKIVIIDKKLFRDDNTRIFVGVVEEYDDGVIRARGSAFHVNPYEVAGTEKAREERVRVFSLAGDCLFYLLPREVEISKVQLKRSPKMMVLTDGSFSIDLSEWMLRA